MSRPDALQLHMGAIGFTELEVDAYKFLLGEAPATGYRVAQGIGRTAASTYRALEGLEKKGAIMVDETANRVCRPVPPHELVSAVEREFRSHATTAREALGKLHQSKADDRVYQLGAPGQVMERARTLIVEARRIVLLDAFPATLQMLAPELAAAARRKVKIAVLAYEPVKLRGVDVILNYEAKAVMARWNAHWLNVVADSSKHVLSLLSTDMTQVLHGTWSESAFLSHLYHSGLLGEMSTSAIRTAVDSGASRKEIERILISLTRLEHMDTHAFTGLTAESRSVPARAAQSSPQPRRRVS